MKNSMMVTFDAISENEAFARIAIAGFLTPHATGIRSIRNGICIYGSIYGLCSGRV